MKTKTYYIKVLGKGIVPYELKYTHRGPLLDTDIIMHTQELFIGKNPLTEKYGHFSLNWAYNFPGESMTDYMLEVMTAKSIPALKASVRDKIKKYVGVGMNVHYADRDGNIGFHGLSATPKRNNSFPHVGQRVMDGTTTQHDWLGEVVDFTDLPFIINPEKGYIHSSNNRIVPENSKTDIGAGVTNSIRNLRIEELLSNRIKSENYFNVVEQAHLQLDAVDVSARLMTPLIVQIGERYLEKHGENKDVRDSVELLKKFGHYSMSKKEFISTGDFQLTSAAATMYATW